MDLLWPVSLIRDNPARDEVGFVIGIYDIDNTWIRVVFSTAEAILSYFLCKVF